MQPEKSSIKTNLQKSIYPIGKILAITLVTLPLLTGCGKDLVQTLRSEACKLKPSLPDCAASTNPAAPEAPVDQSYLNGWEVRKTTYPVSSLQMSPDGNYFTTVGQHHVSVWSTQKNQPIAHFENIHHSEHDTSFHPDGQHFLIVTADHLMVYRLEETKLSEVFKKSLPNAEDINEIGIYPKGELFYLRSQKQQVYTVYDWKTREAIETIPYLPVDSTSPMDLVLTWHPNEPTLVELHRKRGEYTLFTRSFAIRPSVSRLIARANAIPYAVLTANGLGIFTALDSERFAYFDWTDPEKPREFQVASMPSGRPENSHHQRIFGVCATGENEIQVLQEPKEYSGKYGGNAISLTFPKEGRATVSTTEGPFKSCHANQPLKITAYCRSAYAEYGENRRNIPAEISLQTFSKAAEESIPVPKGLQLCDQIVGSPSQKALYLLPSEGKFFYIKSIAENLERMSQKLKK